MQLNNPAWLKSVDRLVRRTSTDLGIPENQRVEARLYKLLVYEKGGHFAIHRDTEKEQGMFASMVLILPCRYAGGKLIVHFGQGKKLIPINKSNYIFFIKKSREEVRGSVESTLFLP